MTDPSEVPKLLASLTFLVVGIIAEQNAMDSLRSRWFSRGQDRGSQSDYDRDFDRCRTRANAAIAKVDEVLEALGIPVSDRIRLGTDLTDYGIELATKVLAGGYAPIWREVVKDA